VGQSDLEQSVQAHGNAPRTGGGRQPAVAKFSSGCGRGASLAGSSDSTPGARLRSIRVTEAALLRLLSDITLSLGLA
jgi:hypothetical protein